MLLALLQYVPAGTDCNFVVDGVSRKARIVAPTVKSERPPIVMCFHGGGGQAYYAVDEYAIHKNWPEALVYYAQGLIGSGGYSTWSRRDVSFFDAMRFDAVHNRGGDPKRLFLMGYSTGANFCGDLWGLRGSEIGGFAFVSGGRYVKGWPPRPVYLNYATDEPEGRRLAQTGALLQIVHGRQGLFFEVRQRKGGHTYPQFADIEIADFLKKCPSL